jgi:hypothetical protein
MTDAEVQRGPQYAARGDTAFVAKGGYIRRPDEAGYAYRGREAPTRASN